MKYILLIALIVAIASGCKDENNVEYPPYSLIGKWEGNDTTLQFIIRSVKDDGHNLKYLEINNEQGRFLRQTALGYVTTYKVLALTKYELVVQDSTGTKIGMHKIGDL